jgi:phosphoglycolate phosphatase-like HAD superfamily hydrolase
LVEKYKINKNECIFITDTLGDLIEAKESGVSSIAVDFGFHDKETLLKGEPYKVISSFSDIRSTVQLII